MSSNAAPATAKPAAAAAAATAPAQAAPANGGAPAAAAAALAAAAATPQPTAAAPRKPTKAEAQAKLAEGKALVKSSNKTPSDLPKAVATLEAALKLAVEAADGDELAFDAAPMYYAYGSALLHEIQRDEGLVHADSGDGGEGSGSGPKSREDTAEDAQVAWENLEAARIIYSKALDIAKTEPKPTLASAAGIERIRDLELALADVHMRLADHSLETEMFDRAQEDYTKCLELQKLHLKPTDRGIAFTLYQLAVTALQLKKESNAIEQYRLSAIVMGAHIQQTAEPHLPKGFVFPTPKPAAAAAAAASAPAPASAAASGNAAAAAHDKLGSEETIAAYNARRVVVDAIFAAFGKALDAPTDAAPAPASAAATANGKPAAAAAAAATAPAAAEVPAHIAKLQELKGIWTDLVERVNDLEITITAAAQNPVSEADEMTALKQVLAAAHSGRAVPDEADGALDDAAKNALAEKLFAAAKNSANGAASSFGAAAAAAAAGAAGTAAAAAEDTFGFGASAWGGAGDSSASSSATTVTTLTAVSKKSSAAAAAAGAAAAAEPVTVLTAKRKVPSAAAASANGAAAAGAAAPAAAGAGETSSAPAAKKAKMV